MLIISNKLTMSLHLSPLEHRVQLFQELVSKGLYYRIKNFNLDLIKIRFRKGKGKFLKPEPWEMRNYQENFCFY
jgi:hypothetical protein